MGARTLVAVERPDGRYDCYRTQWGGEQLDRLVASARAGELPPGLVDPEPVRSAVPADRVLAALDPLEYEALVAVGETVAAYLVVRLGIETSREAAADAAADSGSDGPPAFVRDAAGLVPWTDAAAATRLRRFFRTAKDVLGDAVDAELLSEPVAVGYLAVRLVRHPDVSGGILWVPGGETVS
ncbi:MAG: DUF6735 family protein [Halosimplex sp.]